MTSQVRGAGCGPARGRARALKALVFACACALALCCVQTAQALAATASVATASVTASYANPISGEIEDSAGTGNVTLAESMVEGCTYPSALVEQDADGNTYVTLRFKLADQIGNMQFWADTSGDGAFLSTDSVQMQTGTIDDSAVADYRFLVPGANSNIRISMYVTPMGREVIYFASLSNLTEGNTGALAFVQSVEPGESTTAASTETSQQSAAQVQSQESAEVTSTSATSAETVANSATSSNSENAEAESVEDSDPNEGVKEYNADGQETTEGQSSAPLDAATTGVIVAVIVAVLVIAGAVAYVTYLKPKRARQAAAAASAASAAAAPAAKPASKPVQSAVSSIQADAKDQNTPGNLPASGNR